MYDELIKRLRNRRMCIQGLGTLNDCPLLGEAADAIERLSNAGSAYGRGWTLGYDAGRAESKSRWIPVTERLPNYGKTVLAYGSRGGIFTARFERARTEWGRDAWWKLNSKSHVCNPTHWMPLPQPPKEE